jgi:hypothetical protein
MAGERTPRRNEDSRWNAGKDLSFVPLRPERVVEVRYDHMEVNGSATPRSSTAGGPTATRAHAPTNNSSSRSPSALATSFPASVEVLRRNDESAGVTSP